MNTTGTQSISHSSVIFTLCTHVSLCTSSSGGEVVSDTLRTGSIILHGTQTPKNFKNEKRVFMLFAASKINLKYAFNVQGTCWELSISPVLPGLLQHTRLVETEQQLFKSTLSHLLTLSRPPIGPKHAVLQKTDTISNSTFWLYFHPTIKYYQKKHNRIFLRQNSVRLKLNSRCSLPRESYSPGLAGLAAVTKPCTSTSCTHTL